jgi:hypothetical protein
MRVIDLSLLTMTDHEYNQDRSNQAVTLAVAISSIESSKRKF